MHIFAFCSINFVVVTKDYTPEGGRMKRMKTKKQEQDCAMENCFYNIMAK
jgi:hypothetical protein